MTADYPPADATREKVEAWHRDRAWERQGDRCGLCRDMRAIHKPACKAIGCGCPAFVEPTVTRAELLEALGGKP